MKCPICRPRVSDKLSVHVCYHFVTNRNDLHSEHSGDSGGRHHDNAGYDPTLRCECTVNSSS